MRAAVLLLATALGCSSTPPGLELLVDQPPGVAPAALDVRVYDRFHQLATERIARPVLPGAVRLTSLPAGSAQLRVVVLGLDAAQNVQALAGLTLGTPASSTQTLALHLSPSFADADKDGVPDALDDCPTVADAAQNDARGFGSGPGEACASPDGGADMATADMTPGSDGSGPPDLGPTCPSNAFCDDFEEPQIDMARWMVSQTANTVIEIDSQHAFSGRSSLHVRLGALTQGTLGYVTLKEQATFPTNQMFVRAFILIPADFGNDAAAIFLAEQAVTPFGGIGLQLDSGGFSIFNGLRNQSVAAAGAVRHDSWMCVEWEVTINSAGEGRLWVDGHAQNAPLLNGDTTSVPPVGELAIGLVANATNDVPARDLWMDDVIVSGQPIGCQ